LETNVDLVCFVESLDARVGLCETAPHNLQSSTIKLLIKTIKKLAGPLCEIWHSVQNLAQFLDRRISRWLVRDSTAEPAIEHDKSTDKTIIQRKLLLHFAKSCIASQISGRLPRALHTA
jgi:hypothetical protein